MPEDTPSQFHYQPEPLIKPGANLSVWVWLALFGLPALLLFLIFSKAEEASVATPVPAAMMQMHQPGGHH